MSTAARQVATLPPMFTGPLPSHCRAVLFDIDGTLADSFQLAFTATNHVLANHQHDPVDAEQYHYGEARAALVRLDVLSESVQIAGAQPFACLGLRSSHRDP